MRSRRFVGCAAVVCGMLAAFAGDLVGQQPKAFCFRGDPIAKCRAFAIFEVTGALRLVGTSHPNFYPGAPADKELGEWVAWDAGYMKNLDSTRAVGASLQIGGSGGGTRIALRARHRNWLPHGFAVDLSGGPLLAQQQAADFSGTKQGYGVNGEAAIMAKDLVGVMVATDVVRIQNRTASSLYFGGKVGSHAAVASSGIALLGVVALYFALRNLGD